MNPIMKSIRGHADSVLINSSNMLSSKLHMYRRFLQYAPSWHKFTIENTYGLTRDEILKTILDHVYPLDLIPVYFSQDTNTGVCEFLARNCPGAIRKICDDKLLINFQKVDDVGQQVSKQFKISITLNVSTTSELKIDVQKNVLAVLTKRFQLSTKTLDLNNFVRDPGLTEYCPLSQPKMMYFVFHVAKSFSPEKIILSNNDIKVVNSLEDVLGAKLKAIDLSNNHLTNLDDLPFLKLLNIKELTLTGNPLCNCEESEYVSKIRSVCPTIEVLDGIPIRRNKFPISKRSFLCNDTGFSLTNDFLEYFFTIYDSPNRKDLLELYHPDAMFSLTANYIPHETTSNTAHMKTYNILSRNLKRTADLSKTTDYIVTGRDDVLFLFGNRLPATQHDRYSFSVDLVIKDETYAVIVVTGIFRETENEDRVMGFMRTFCLKFTDRGHHIECVITNEQLHVHNALSVQVRSAFLHPPITAEQIFHKPLIPEPKTADDVKVLVSTFKAITNLRTNWAKSCLDQCDNNLKKSIEWFLELYRNDKIPKYAFME